MGLSSCDTCMQICLNVESLISLNLSPYGFVVNQNLACQETDFFFMSKMASEAIPNVQF